VPFQMAIPTGSADIAARWFSASFKWASMSGPLARATDPYNGQSVTR